MKAKVYFNLLFILFLFFVVGCSNNIVTFVDYDGSVIKEVTTSGSITPPDDPNREGYSFIGWDQDLKNINSDTTVTALYEPKEYFLKFSDLDLEIKVAYDSEVTELPSYTKEGHKFVGWELNNELVKLPFIYIYTSDIMLTPKLIECTTYTISFYGKDSILLSKEIVLEGEEVQSPNVPEIEGYTFSGWDREFSNPKTNLTVNAIYEAKTYQVTFSGSSTTQVKYNGYLNTYPTPSKEGSDFLGWEYNGELIRFPYNYKYSKDITLTPRFKANSYSVKFYNYKNELIQITNVDYGDNVLAPDNIDRVGYEFLGWDQPLTNIKSNLVVRPKYKPLEFTIFFENVSLNPITVRYDDNINLTSLWKQGYVFEGWFYQEEKIADSFKFNYLNDLNLTPKFREDDYEEMMNLSLLVDNWLGSANSLRIHNIIKIRESRTHTTNLIKVDDLTYIYPEYGYYENKVYTDGKLENHQLIKDESGTLYLYKIKSRQGNPSTYTKEIITENDFIDDSGSIIEDFTREFTYEKMEDNVFLITSTFGNFSFYNDLASSYSELLKYKNNVMTFLFAFEEVDNTLYIRIKMDLDFYLEYEMIIDMYNAVEMIDIESSDYEQIGTYQNPEVIDDISKTITKTQGVSGSSTIYRHYYTVELEAGYYLFDFEKHEYDFEDTYYSISFQNENGFGQPLHPITNSMTINEKRVFYVEGGVYKFILDGKHRFGYSFSIKPLDYVSYSEFANPQPIADSITGVIEGIYDLNVYTIETNDLYNLVTFSNIGENQTIVHVSPTGEYNVFSNFGDSVTFEIKKGQNLIIVTGSEASTYNLNIEVDDIIE